ncbi:MAG: nitrogenase iron protein [Candidatus Omnitrophota bacterium]|jgi:nitrogenase subunit NifH
MGKASKIVIYGKGGIGKSMIAGNLSILYAKRGLKVLQIGCDPKHDSTRQVLGRGGKISTVMDVVSGKDLSSVAKEDIVFKGARNVDCIECGGPKPGVGCAGRGISLMFEILGNTGIIERGKYDVVIFDALGDVVCGGFAAPLRAGFADKAFIVISEELASLYAANNITQAVTHYAYNGIYLGGLILNLRDNGADVKHVYNFAGKLNTRILARIPRSEEITAAEHLNKTAAQEYPVSDITRVFSSLADNILSCGRKDTGKLRHIEEDRLRAILKG